MNIFIDDRTSNSVLCVPRYIVMVQIIELTYHHYNKKGKKPSSKSYILAAFIVHHVTISESKGSNAIVLFPFHSTPNYIPTWELDLIINFHICYSILHAIELHWTSILMKTLQKGKIYFFWKHVGIAPYCKRFDLIWSNCLSIGHMR